MLLTGCAHDSVSHTLFLGDFMIVFNTDLDNTIIYSYKHDIGTDKINVELYQGREISFISKETFALLQKVKEQMLIVPTTTRTIEQYNRIDLGIGEFKYALTCNGGILLVDGKSDESWYKTSLDLVKESNDIVAVASDYLDKCPARYFELRYIENLFLFTKCSEPEKVVKDLIQVLNSELVDVFNNGDKVYVVPRKLSKGRAIRRFQEYIKAEYVIAAGDSEFDISMVTEADKGIVPHDFIKEYEVEAKDGIWETPKDKLFSEEVLKRCLEIKAELS